MLPVPFSSPLLLLLLALKSVFPFSSFNLRALRTEVKESVRAQEADESHMVCRARAEEARSGGHCPMRREKEVGREYRRMSMVQILCMYVCMYV
jgi:hypothetical protein